MRGRRAVSKQGYQQRNLSESCSLAEVDLALNMLAFLKILRDVTYGYPIYLLQIFDSACSTFVLLSQERIRL